MKMKKAKLVCQLYLPSFERAWSSLILYMWMLFTRYSGGGALVINGCFINSKALGRINGSLLRHNWMNWANTEVYSWLHWEGSRIGGASRKVDINTFIGEYFEFGAWPYASSRAVIANDQISTWWSYPLPSTISYDGNEEWSVHEEKRASESK